jgi:hypothetical protein
MLDHIKMSIMDPILKRIDPDLAFSWDYGQSEAEQLDLTTKYASITTVNERRKMMGLDPLSDEEGGNVIDNEFIQQQKQQQQEAQQAQAMGGQGGDDESGGDPSGEPGQPQPKTKGKSSKDDSKESDEEEIDYANEKPQERIARLVRKHQAKAKG